jgi:hypothetical protein
MPQYLRAFAPGGTFFFTVSLLQRRQKLLTENIDNFREVFKAARRRRPFAIDGIYNLEWMADGDVWRLEMNGANGGMRFAFPPYGPPARPDGNRPGYQPGGVNFSFGPAARHSTIKIRA